jgi:hypothetical protein
MTNLTFALNGMKHQDDDDRALALLPILADRMKYHTRRLRIIRYIEGLEGEKAYKSKHPEARPIQTRATSTAWQNKPAGYDDYLATLALQWLTIDGAVASTNIAEVERLNAHFATTRFSPAKQFSLPLSKSAKSKIRTVFTSRGVPLDTSKKLSMSGVREAAKAAKAVAQQDSRPFGRFGTMSGNSLVTGGRVTPI